MWDSLDISSTKEREESKINPRLRADVHSIIGWVEGSESDGLHSFKSCCGRPISMNAVLDGFIVRRFAIIQEQIEEIVISS